MLWMKFRIKNIVFPMRSSWIWWQDLKNDGRQYQLFSIEMESGDRYKAVQLVLGFFLITIASLHGDKWELETEDE